MLPARQPDPVALALQRLETKQCVVTEPLPSWSRSPANLPPELTSFVGREQELRELRDLLGATHLLTLTGVGGAATTRLAQRLAKVVLADYSGGVWLVDLAPLPSPELVSQAVASAFGLHEQSGHRG